MFRTCPLLLLPFLLFGLFTPAARADIGTVTLAEVQALVATPPDKGNYLLVDARPEIKFYEGHIPWAVSIPKQEMLDRLEELPADLDTQLVFYCGGVKCELSSEAAAIASEQGYRKVAVFPEGMPAWEQAEIPWVSSNFIKMVLNDPKRVALLIDSRPPLKYLEGTIPGALNLPWPQFEHLQGLLPADKQAQLIFFCGGLSCDLSHKSAAAARALGYSKVASYAYGWPDWKKASSRGFALVDPKSGGSAVTKAEALNVPGVIAVEEFKKLVASPGAGTLLVDVRPANEFEEAHLPGAVNIPDEQVETALERLKGYARVVFYCNTGSRAAVAYYAAEAGRLKNTLFLNQTLSITADGNYQLN